MRNRWPSLATGGCQRPPKDLFDPHLLSPFAHSSRRVGAIDLHNGHDKRASHKTRTPHWSAVSTFFKDRKHPLVLVKCSHCNADARRILTGGTDMISLSLSVFSFVFKPRVKTRFLAVELVVVVFSHSSWFLTDNFSLRWRYSCSLIRLDFLTEDLSLRIELKFHECRLCNVQNSLY